MLRSRKKFRKSAQLVGTTPPSEHRKNEHDLSQQLLIEEATAFASLPDSTNAALDSSAQPRLIRHRERIQPGGHTKVSLTPFCWFNHVAELGGDVLFKISSEAGRG